MDHPSSIIIACLALLAAIGVIAVTLLGGGLPTWATVIVLLIGIVVAFGALGALVRTFSTDA